MNFSTTSQRRVLFAAALVGAAVATGRFTPAPLTAQRAVGATVGGAARQGTTALVGGTLIDGNGGAPITNLSLIHI